MPPRRDKERMTTVVGDSNKQARKIQKAQAKTNNIGPQNFSRDGGGGEWRRDANAERNDPWSQAPVAWFPKDTSRDERMRTLRELANKGKAAIDHTSLS